MDAPLSINNYYSAIELLLIFTFGCIIFFTTILDDWLNKKKILRSFAWYLQEFIYTILGIGIGLSACLAFEFSRPVAWLVSIVMGLIGSTLIRKLKLRKESIADNVINSVEIKIKSTIENPISAEFKIPTPYDNQFVDIIPTMAYPEPEPEQIKSEPEQIKSEPEQIKSEPEQIKSEPFFIKITQKSFVPETILEAKKVPVKKKPVVTKVPDKKVPVKEKPVVTKVPVKKVPVKKKPIVTNLPK